MKREDTTFPTVAAESVFITSNIDVFEGQKVATMDVPSSFLHTPMDTKYPKVYMVVCRKELGTSIVAIFCTSNTSIFEVMNTLSAATVGKVVSSFFIVCLCGCPYVHDLPFMSPFIF